MDPFASWTADLTRRGFGVLPAGHPVPVELWAVLPDDPGSVLHLRARGTRVVLRRYAASDLATAVLRSECDCAEHRTAGAGVRTVLVPGAMPTAEAEYDGAARHGWRSHEAGLMSVTAVALVFEELLARLPAGVGGRDPGRTPTPDATGRTSPPSRSVRLQAQRPTDGEVTSRWRPVAPGPRPTRSRTRDRAQR